MRPYTSPGLGWLLGILGLILVIVFAVLGRIDTLHAALFGLAFLAFLL